jgi:RecA/RadA recombinase
MHCCCPVVARGQTASNTASSCRRSHARALLSDSDWSAGEGDVDSDDDALASGVDRGNAVLLTGPVGSGKTAAAYAVAMVRLSELWLPIAHIGCHTQ